MAPKLTGNGIKTFSSFRHPLFHFPKAAVSRPARKTFTAKRAGKN
jgi:hypothetical protein